MRQFTVNALNLYYGQKQALQNISLTIPAHQVTALIGPSGCGKSTFLRCLNRMNDLIDSVKIDGEILLGTDSIYEASYDVVSLRTHVGMVFQQPNPFPMSIYNNVAYGLKVQGVKDKKILDEAVVKALKQAALYDEVSERLHESALGLSGGQQQRLCIARAIALEPEVILMDEPTSALDPIATAKIEQLIMELKTSYTIVIVTHSMQQAARISDKTAFFLMGDLVEFNETKVLFHTPQDERTENYITGRFG